MIEYKNFILDRFQEEALEIIERGHSLIVSAPTGSGKTLIAEYVIGKALKENRSVIYTAPIKALSNQKFRDFNKEYPDKVGIMTGDVTLNDGAQILIMTTEIFRNVILEEPERFSNVSYLILDEVHYLDDKDRGSVWEESIIFAPEHIKVVCLSATVANLDELADWIRHIRKGNIEVVLEQKRPIPLLENCFLEKEGILNVKNVKKHLPKKIKSNKNIWREKIDDTYSSKEILDYIIANQQIPCLYFVFSRKECENKASKWSERCLLNNKEIAIVKKRIVELIERYNINLELSLNIWRLLSRGIAYHHAGMMPALKEIVEQLFTEGLIKLLFATETFSLGINMPATSVVFSSLEKYDGIEMRRLKTLEYQQMAGRAGRRGLDSVGYVYANLVGNRITADEFENLFKGKVESIKSQFNLCYNTLLNLYTMIGVDVVKACDKSFAAFQLTSKSKIKNRKKRAKKIYEEQKKDVKKKIAFLKILGYIDKKGITSKGKFAAQINGCEIELTELFFDGLFEEKDEMELFVILVSLIFQGKKGEWHSKIPKKIKKTSTKVKKIIEKIISVEYMMELKNSIDIPDFRLSGAAQAWAAGKTFVSLENYTRADSGDIIRTFRQAIQLLRQLRKACEGYDYFINLIDRCIIAVDRDEVNALKQLTAFTNTNSSLKSKHLQKG